MKAKFILIDGNSLANRAFYAIPMLSNSQGLITNAVYGFCNMLFRVLEEEKPQYVAVAFDKGRTVFRHGDYAQYKAQRKGTPDELRPQFPVLKNLLKSLNIAVYELEGYEADDIIGTLVQRGEQEGLDNLVLTGDRDALQLISAQTKVYLTKKGISELEKYDELALKEKYGLNPRQIIDLKGLMGDASDNIPGIPGVGEKTALKLVQDHGSVEEALASHDAYRGKKLGELLREYAEQARLSKKLATIACDVPLEGDLTDCLVREPDYNQVIPLLKELEFKNILQMMLEKMAASGSGQASAEIPPQEGRTVSSLEGLKECLAGENIGLTLYFRSEKTGIVDYELQELALKSPGCEPVILTWQTEEELTGYLGLLKTVLEQEAIPKTVYDAKALYLLLDSSGIKLKGVVRDTMLMAYVLNPSRPHTGLPALVQDYLNKALPPMGEPQAIYTLLAALEDLGLDLEEELRKVEMWSLYYDLELPLSRVLAVMEKTGVHLDRNVLVEMGEDLDIRLGALTGEIYSLAGEEFNINSPKQMGIILFEKMGLTKGKKTKTGYSTSAEVLEALAPDHEIVAKILQYRQLAKLKSTYIDGLQAIMDTKTGKVHTSLNQAVTATGRLSSTEPNLQNIPIRLEEGRRIRKAFLSSTPNRLLSADYSQIELRVLAHLAQDEVLIEAFNRDQDIHTRTASEVFGVPMDLVSKEMRRAAKAVNFGIVYGISDFGLGQDLGVTRPEARNYIDNYFARYSGVKRYLEDVVAQARENGYVTTILNRRRYLPDILSSNFHLRSFAERTAMNTPIQGSAADIIKLAMLMLQEYLEKEMPHSRMILQVHDELIFEVPQEEIPGMARMVNELMSKAYPLAVPLKVDIQTGPNWYDLEPFKI